MFTSLMLSVVIGLGQPGVDTPSDQTDIDAKAALALALALQKLDKPVNTPQALRTRPATPVTSKSRLTSPAGCVCSPECVCGCQNGSPCKCQTLTASKVTTPRAIVQQYIVQPTRAGLYQLPVFETRCVNGQCDTVRVR